MTEPVSFARGADEKFNDVLSRLQSCLVELDDLGIGSVAAQLDLAIRQLREALESPRDIAAHGSATLVEPDAGVEGPKLKE